MIRDRDALESASKAYYISPNIPFLETLSRYLLELSKDDPLSLGSYCVLLPTQRSLRTLKYLLGTTSKKSLFLPNLYTLNDLVPRPEDFLAAVCKTLSHQDLDALNLPQPLSPLRARLLCAEALKRAPSLFDTPLRPTQIFELSESLLKVLEEILTHPIPIELWKKYIPSTHATHWEKIEHFLKTLSYLWPEILKAENASDPGVFAQRRLEILGKILNQKPLKSPLIIAGIRGLSPNFIPLLKAVSHSAKSIFLFDSLHPDFLQNIPKKMTPHHPLHEQISLLRDLQVPLDTLRPLPFSERSPATCPRTRLLFVNHALSFESLGETSSHDFEKCCDGVSFFEATSPQEEARLIALKMRHILETPNKTAALVTPDRTLAKFVKAELLRWGIRIDDSGGIPLSDLSCGLYFLMSLRTILSNYTPLSLIALLKHPLTRMGRNPNSLESTLKTLELYALRGLKMSPGLQSLEERLRHARIQASPQLKEDLDQALLLLSDLKKTCEPLERTLKKGATPALLLKCHEDILLNLSLTEQGIPLLWGENSEKEAFSLFEKICEETYNLPPLQHSFYLPFLEDLFKNTLFQPKGDVHPRLTILGLFESRLLTKDCLILGSLNEGTWPDLPTANPWLNRHLMDALNLPDPMVRIGVAIQDFIHGFLSSEVLLTRSKRDFQGIKRPSRILIYLKAFLESKGLSLPSPSEAELLRHLETPPPIKSSSPPKPTPPINARPHIFSVSDIETWIKDPYGFYARKILNIRPLHSFEETPTSADFGSLVHKLLEKAMGTSPPSILTMGTAFETTAFFKALSEGEKYFWKAHLLDLLERFLIEHAQRHSLKTLHEVDVTFELCMGDIAEHPFILNGRIDRLEVESDHLHIIDYKTGNLPSFENIENGTTPQLPLLGMMLKYGENNPSLTHEILLSYWPLKKQKRIKNDPLVSIKNPDFLIKITLERFKKLLHLFYAQNSPASYEALAYGLSSYTHLSRIKEWAGPMEALEFSESDIPD